MPKTATHTDSCSSCPVGCLVDTAELAGILVEAHATVHRT